MATRDFALAIILLLGGALLHVWYLIADCPLDLSGDEAHYWEWSRHLDWSYYSKGPLVAYIIAAGRVLFGGLSQQLLGNEVLAIRGPAVLLSVGTGLGLFVLVNQTLRSSRLALAAVAITFTIPILAVGAILLTIDAPLSFCHIWALVACHRGLHTGRLWPWLIAGVLIALGILAKYTMVLIFPIVGLAILCEPQWRKYVPRLGPWLALAIGTLGFVPILIWNAQHNWVSFRHVAGQAGVSGGRAIFPLGPLEMLGGQLAVVGPLWLLMMFGAVWNAIRALQPQPSEHHTAADTRLLLIATLAPWCLFVAFSFITKIQPNWPVLAVFPGIALMLLALRRDWNAINQRRRVTLLLIAATALGGTTVIVMHRTEYLMPVFRWLARNEPPWNLTPCARYDPTSRLRGWRELGQAVGEVRDEMHATGRNPFIATDDYQVASQITFYCPGNPPVYCFQASLGDRQSQYDMWKNPIRDADPFIGRPVIYVGSRKPELFGGPQHTEPALECSAEPVRQVEHRVRGELIQLWPIYACDEYLRPPASSTSRPHRY